MAITKAAREEARRLNALGRKKCTHCGEVKGLNDFNKHSGNWDGLMPCCRPCQAVRNTATRARYRARWESEDPRANPAPLRCCRCTRSLPRSAFATNPTGADGLDARCLDCRKVINTALRERNQAWWAVDDPYSDPSPKRCGECRQTRPRSDFSTAPTHADGLYPLCRRCTNDRDANRSAQKRGNWVEHVDRHRAWALEGGMCILCGHPVPRDAFDLDHVFPLVLGGEHSYANTGPAHPLCNRSKGARQFPDVSWDPDDLDPAPRVYVKGVLPVWINGVVWRGTEIIATETAEALAEDVEPDLDEGDLADEELAASA